METKEIKKFEMKIKRDKNGKEFKIQVELGFSEVTREQLIEVCSGGSSTRVTLQAKLRKRTVEELQRLEETGLKISFQEVYEKEIVSPVERLGRLGQEDFIETMVQGLGLDRETALRIWAKKFGTEN